MKWFHNPPWIPILNVENSCKIHSSWSSWLTQSPNEGSQSTPFTSFRQKLIKMFAKLQQNWLRCAIVTKVKMFGSRHL